MIICTQFLDDILIGSGKQSEDLCPIITLPSSHPHNIECIQDSENQLTFKWDEPIKIAPDVEVDNYNFKLVKEEESHHEPTTESTTTELSTEPSKHPESYMEDSISISTMPNSRLNPIPFPDKPTYPPERPQKFYRFLDFLDFLSFARSKDKNVLMDTEEATTSQNVDGMKFDIKDKYTFSQVLYLYFSLLLVEKSTTNMPDTNSDTSEKTTPKTVASTISLPVKPQHAKKWEGNIEGTSLYFDKLESSTLYSFRVRYLGKPIIYVMNDQEAKFKIKSPYAVAECYTKTKRITGLKQMDVTKNSISLEWNSHSKLPPNSKFLYYTLFYWNFSTNVSDTHKNIKNTSYNLVGLEKGTKYWIKIQVVTTDGSSLFSDPILIRTQGKSSDIKESEEILQTVVSI